MPGPTSPSQQGGDKQVTGMVAFLRAEAGEKCDEIKTKAKFEYERVFQELKRQKRQQVQAEYKQKRQNSHIQRLIDSAHKKAEANSSLITLRATLVEQLKQDVIKRLDAIEKHPQYSALLTNLIVEGIIALQEEEVQVRCRKIDEPLVKTVLVTARELFIKAVEESTGYTPLLEPITIDTANYLPGPFKEGAVEYCLGGIDVTAKKGKLLCSNRLDKRLQLAFQHLLPQIRAYCFGEIPKKVQDGQLPHHLTTF